MSFTDGLMTGANLGRGMYRARTGREIGGFLASGDVAGAQQAAAATGDTEMLGQVQQWASTVSAQERAQAAQRAEGLARVGIQLRSVTDPAQRRAQAIQLAGQNGVPVESIPEVITDDMLDGWVRSNMSAAEMLSEQRWQAEEARRTEQANRWTYSPQMGGWMGPQGFVPPGGQAQPQAPRSLGSSLDDEWEPVRPNQPPSAPAAGGGERRQPVSVSFQSSRDAQAAITQLVPGARVTSGARSPADNRRVGGAPGSFHLQDRARDLVPPPGMSMAQLEAKMRQAGFRALNEGDHIHVSW
jgi:hypothetical protein